MPGTFLEILYARICAECPKREKWHCGRGLCELLCGWSRIGSLVSMAEPPTVKFRSVLPNWTTRCSSSSPVVAFPTAVVSSNDEKQPAAVSKEPQIHGIRQEHFRFFELSFLELYTHCKAMFLARHREIARA